MKLAEVHQVDFGTDPLPEAEAGQDFPLIIATMPATARQRAIAVGIPQGRGKKRCTAKKRRCTASEILSNHAAAARFTVASASEVRLSSVFFSSCSV
jgi:hypothetical protein